MIDHFEMTCQSTDRGGYGQPSKWQIVLTHKPSGYQYSTEYTSGCAHRTWTNRPPPSSSWGKWWKRGKKIQQEIYCRQLKNCDANHQLFADFEQYTKPIKPTLRDILELVASDVTCVWQGESFEDFASDFGYDEDSRRAEKTYHSLIKIAQWFRRCGIDITELNESLQSD